MDADELLAVEDKYDFATKLYYFLLDTERALTPLQKKFSTCYWVISQHDNGGLSGMLYNADDRESWCWEVAGYCRDLGAEESARVFGDIAPIFSLLETEGSTWGDYLERADPEKKLDGLSGFDPNDDLFAALITFSVEKRDELVHG